MDPILEHAEKARRSLRIADHMATTYPVVKDNKMFISAIENLFLAASHSMTALLHSEREFKRIPPFQDGFDSKYSLLKERCAERCGLKDEHLEFVLELKQLMLQKRKSTSQKAIKDGLVLYDGNQPQREITLSQIKNYIGRTKSFIGKIEEVISKNEPYARV